jgi:hypothetical protein
MADKTKFEKVSVKPEVKREIGIIAASENRFEYEIVADAMNLYKQVAIGKGPIVKKNRKTVSVADVIASH